MKDRAELYQEIKKFFKQEVEPLLKKYEKERNKYYPIYEEYKNTFITEDIINEIFSKFCLGK